MRRFFFFISIFLAIVTRGETFEITTPYHQIKNNRIEVEGFGSTFIQGAPWLPCKIVWIAIPPGSEIISCEVSSRGWTQIGREARINPAPCVLKEGNYSLKEEVIKYSKAESLAYNLNQLYPEIAGKEIGIYQFREYKLAKIIIFPFAYNPVTGNLYYSPSITININYTQPKITVPLDTIMDEVIKQDVINFNQTKNWYQEKALSPYNYLIISPPELINVVKDFAKWKESIGYKVKIILPSKIEQEMETNRSLNQCLPKYILIIGELFPPVKPVWEQTGVIIGRIPYVDSELVKTILDRTIEFEINKSRRRILFVKGISNHENEDSSGLKMEDKSSLMEKLESITAPQWDYEEFENEEIFGEYPIINFLSSGKHWLRDDGDSVPEPEEIELSNYVLRNISPCFVFSPFPGAKFLKQGAVCVVAPDSFSQYVVGWEDSSCGGSQSFNYTFLKYLIKKKIVGDAFCQTKFWYETYFPQDTQNTKAFKIFGDPTLSLKGVPLVDLGIVGTPACPTDGRRVKWIPPDTEFSPSCEIYNFGRNEALNFKVYCEIDSTETTIYNKCIAIDTLKPLCKKHIKFPKWKPKGTGIGYKFKFQLFSPQDENLDNDTLSTIGYIAAGDFIAWEQNTTISNKLKKLGYKGTYINKLSSVYPWLKNFKSLFISSEVKDEADSIFNFLQEGGNLYIEGSNIWLNKLLKGKKETKAVSGQISGKGLSFNCSKIISQEWFMPNNSVPTFYAGGISTSGGKDSTNIVGFSYENGYKIWSTKFKLSEIQDSFNTRTLLLDSVMHFFGIYSKFKEQFKEPRKSNLILYQNTPNPFYDQTIIKFKILTHLPEVGQETTCRVNLSIYNLAGNLIKNLLDEQLSPGEYESSWDAQDESGKPVANGVYFLRLQSVTQQLKENQLVKIIVLK